MHGEIYIVQSWCHKKTNAHNDDVDIMGIFRELENARTFINDRFMYFLIERHRELCNFIFPKTRRRDEIAIEVRKKFDDFLTRKIVSYVYGDSDKSLVVGQKIPDKAYCDQKVRIPLNLNQCFLQLMDLQSWISNRSPDAYFPEYCEIPIIINDELSGSIRRMSSETCRLIIYDITGKKIFYSFYIGQNIIDVEDCENRERHFCSSYRIIPKTFRD